MCTLVNHRTTIRYGYKIVAIKDGRVYSPKFSLYIWKKGYNKADGDTVIDYAKLMEGIELSIGFFHFYPTLEEAEEDLRYPSSYYFAMTVHYKIIRVKLVSEQFANLYETEIACKEVEWEGDFV